MPTHELHMQRIWKGLSQAAIPKPLWRRIRRVIQRLQFVYRLEENLPRDDPLKVLEAESLKLYLLCTCIDTLAGPTRFTPFESWLSKKKLPERDKVICEELGRYEAGSGHAVSVEVFRDVATRVYLRYNQDFGVGKKFRQSFEELPRQYQEKLASSYIIVCSGDEPKGSPVSSPEKRTTWNGLSTAEGVKRIADYLYQYRRNAYTHDCTVAPSTSGKKGWEAIIASRGDEHVWIACNQKEATLLEEAIRTTIDTVLDQAVKP